MFEPLTCCLLFFFFILCASHFFLLVAPPYVPTVTSGDDTSNFDEFEPESRPYIGDLKGRKEFTGKNLPFVGFTYTAPFQMNTER